MTEILYVLQCEDDKWYVGKTSDIAKRFKQHQAGTGAAWTREYKPIRVAETRAITSCHDETNLTKDYMKKYGVENVRGGAYSQVELSDEMETTIKHELKASTDACFNCGKKGHFAKNCPKNEEEDVWACEYCDAEFKSESACQRHENSCGGQIDYRTTQRAYGSCYRCGRKGHWAPECYARSHVSGYDLD